MLSVKVLRANRDLIATTMTITTTMTIITPRVMEGRPLLPPRVDLMCIKDPVLKAHLPLLPAFLPMCIRDPVLKAHLPLLPAFLPMVCHLLACLPPVCPPLGQHQDPSIRPPVLRLVHN